LLTDMLLVRHQLDEFRASSAEVVYEQHVAS
jgi:hypothetical protein